MLSINKTETSLGKNGLNAIWKRVRNERKSKRTYDRVTGNLNEFNINDDSQSAYIVDISPVCKDTKTYQDRSFNTGEEHDHIGDHLIYEDQLTCNEDMV